MFEKRSWFYALGNTSPTQVLLGVSPTFPDRAPAAVLLLAAGDLWSPLYSLAHAWWTGPVEFVA